MWEDEKEVFWYAGKLGKNMQNLKERVELDPFRVRGDREWVRPTLLLCWDCLKAPLLSVSLQQSLSHLCKRGHARSEQSQSCTEMSSPMAV